MSKILCVSVISLAAFCIAVGLLAVLGNRNVGVPSESNGARIDFTEDHYFLGTFDRRTSPIEHSVFVQRADLRPAKLSRIETSCGCTTATIVSPAKHSSSVEIRLQLDASSVGTNSVRLVAYSDDGFLRCSSGLSYEVRPLIEVSVDSSEFGNVGTFETISTELKITGPNAKSSEIRVVPDISTKQQELGVRFYIQHRGEGHYQVVVETGSAVGAQFATLQIQDFSDNQLHRPIPLGWHCDGILATPSSLTLKRGTFQSTVLLSGDVAGLDIQRVECTPRIRMIEWNSESIMDGDLLRVDFELKDARNSETPGEIRLFLTDGSLVRIYIK